MTTNNNLSLGRKPELQDAPQKPTSSATPTDGTDSINADTWQKMEASRITNTLNTASGLSPENMIADFEHGLLANPPQETARGVCHAESRLFISEWFDPKLEGKAGIVHGADFMYIISKLVEQTTDSEIAGVTEIQFTGVVKNEVDLFVSRGPAPEDTKKPVMTATIRLKNGADLIITAYDKPDKPITQRSASNTFVQHLCVKSLTKHAAKIKWALQHDKDFTPPTNFEIELSPLPPDQQAAFAKFHTKNPTGFTASTALDIVITGTQVLAYLGRKAGGIPEINALGAGFSNVTLPPVEKLINGCKLRLTVLNDNIRTTAKAEFWPIKFEFIDIDTNATLGQGIFNWVNRLSLSQPGML